MRTPTHTRPDPPFTGNARRCEAYDGAVLERDPIPNTPTDAARASSEPAMTPSMNAGSPSLPRATSRRLRRWIAPSLASLALHAALGVVIGTVAIGTYMRSTPEMAPIEIVVDFSHVGLGEAAAPDARGERDSPQSDSPRVGSTDAVARVATSAGPSGRDALSAATPADPSNQSADAALRSKIAERLAAVNSQGGTSRAIPRSGSASPDGSADPDQGRSAEGSIGNQVQKRLGNASNTGSGTLAGVAPPATFAGLQASNAQSIAYVVDASGSLIGTLPVVRRELEASLRTLTSEQRFAVLFFQRNAALEPPMSDQPVQRDQPSQRGRLQPATPTAIDRTLRWAEEIRPTGRSNPLPALERALKLEPDVIFLLSADITGSGDFEMGRDELLKALDRLNPLDPATGRRPTRIHCVQFLDADPLDTLRRIAEIHGGRDAYRFLSRESLGLGAKAIEPLAR
jgi:hypothetical protein